MKGEKKDRKKTKSSRERKWRKKPPGKASTVKINETQKKREREVEVGGELGDGMRRQCRSYRGRKMMKRKGRLQGRK